VLQADIPRAKAAYQDFLTLWNDADPDVPVLQKGESGVREVAVGKRTPHQTLDFIAYSARKVTLSITLTSILTSYSGLSTH
jgi:hypothetical protein